MRRKQNENENIGYSHEGCGKLYQNVEKDPNHSEIKVLNITRIKKKVMNTN